MSFLAKIFKSRQVVVYKDHQYTKGVATLDQNTVPACSKIRNQLPMNVDSKTFENLQERLMPQGIELNWIVSH